MVSSLEKAVLENHSDYIADGIVVFTEAVSVNSHASAVLFKKGAYYINGRRLARTVRTQEGKHFTCFDIKIDAFYGMDAAVGFVQSVNFYYFIFMIL